MSDHKLWWVPDDSEIYVMATYTGVDLPNGCSQYELCNGSKKLVTKSKDQVFPCYEADPESIAHIEDLSFLPDVNTASILHTTRTRFQKRKIYSSMGTIMMSINPFERIHGLYGHDMMERYRNPNEEGLPAHLYAIPSRSYVSYCESQKNQAIIISGESGSGKTEAAKECLNYLTYITNSVPTPVDPSSTAPRHISLAERILNTSAILEAFGNASTSRNPNSSRFGKWMELNLNTDNIIVKSTIVSYLLEKSRVTKQLTNERNYHIFYQLLNGLSLPELQSWHIYPQKKLYRYLTNDLSKMSASHHKDSINLKEVIESFEKCGFPKNRVLNIFKIVTSLLLLGNIDFIPDDESHNDACKVNLEDGTCQHLSDILCVPMEMLKESLCTRSIESGVKKNIISIQLNPEKAANSRDNLARCIYDKLFSYIIQCINHLNQPNPSLASGSDSEPTTPLAGGVTNFNLVGSIGLLDIFGFEILELNSFEQLCINYCNEILQQHFNYVVFIAEQKLYESQDITCDTIEYKDNSHIIKEVEVMFKTLDDEGKLPKGSSLSWYEKSRKAMKSSSVTGSAGSISNSLHNTGGGCVSYIQKKQSFVVTHYAAKVEYHSEQLLDKNIEVVNNELIQTMMHSSDEVLNNLFGIATPSSTTTGGDEPKKRSSVASRRFSFAKNMDDNSEVVMDKIHRRNSKKPEERSAASIISRFKSDSLTSSIAGGTGSSSAGSGSGSGSGPSGGNKSISWMFKHQLVDLMKVLKSTENHFIRCIKSNPGNQPLVFDNKLVNNQLLYSGVYEVIKIQQSGLPYRISHEEFIKRFKCIIQPSKLRELCVMEGSIHLFLEKLKGIAGIPRESTHIQAGRTMLFSKNKELAILETLKRELHHKTAIKLQAALARALYSRKYRKLREPLHRFEKELGLYRLDYVEDYYNSICTGIAVFHRLYYSSQIRRHWRSCSQPHRPHGGTGAAAGLLDSVSHQRGGGGFSPLVTRQLSHGSYGEMMIDTSHTPFQTPSRRPTRSSSILLVTPHGPAVGGDILSTPYLLHPDPNDTAIDIEDFPLYHVYTSKTKAYQKLREQVHILREIQIHFDASIQLSSDYAREHAVTIYSSLMTLRTLVDDAYRLDLSQHKLIAQVSSLVSRFTLALQICESISSTGREETSSTDSTADVYQLMKFSLEELKQGLVDMQEFMYVIPRAKELHTQVQHYVTQVDREMSQIYQPLFDLFERSQYTYNVEKCSLVADPNAPMESAASLFEMLKQSIAIAAQYPLPPNPAALTATAGVAPAGNVILPHPLPSYILSIPTPQNQTFLCQNSNHLYHDVYYFLILRECYHTAAMTTTANRRQITTGSQEYTLLHQLITTIPAKTDILKRQLSLFEMWLSIDRIYNELVATLTQNAIPLTRLGNEKSLVDISKLSTALKHCNEIKFDGLDTAKATRSPSLVPQQQESHPAIVQLSKEYRILTISQLPLRLQVVIMIAHHILLVRQSFIDENWLSLKELLQGTYYTVYRSHMSPSEARNTPLPPAGSLPPPTDLQQLYPSYYQELNNGQWQCDCEAYLTRIRSMMTFSKISSIPLYEKSIPASSSGSSQPNNDSLQFLTKVKAFLTTNLMNASFCPELETTVPILESSVKLFTSLAMANVKEAIIHRDALLQYSEKTAYEAAMRVEIGCCNVLIKKLHAEKRIEDCMQLESLHNDESLIYFHNHLTDKLPTSATVIATGVVTAGVSEEKAAAVDDTITINYDRLQAAIKHLQECLTEIDDVIVEYDKLHVDIKPSPTTAAATGATGAAAAVLPGTVTSSVPVAAPVTEESSPVNRHNIKSALNSIFGKGGGSGYNSSPKRSSDIMRTGDDKPLSPILLGRSQSMPNSIEQELSLGGVSTQLDLSEAIKGMRFHADFNKKIVIAQMLLAGRKVLLQAGAHGYSTVQVKGGIRPLPTAIVWKDVINEINVLMSLPPKEIEPILREGVILRDVCYQQYAKSVLDSILKQAYLSLPVIAHPAAATSQQYRPTVILLSLHTSQKRLESVGEMLQQNSVYISRSLQSQSLLCTVMLDIYQYYHHCQWIETLKTIDYLESQSDLCHSLQEQYPNSRNDITIIRTEYSAVNDRRECIIELGLLRCWNSTIIDLSRELILAEEEEASMKYLQESTKSMTPNKRRNSMINIIKQEKRRASMVHVISPPPSINSMEGTTGAAGGGNKVKVGTGLDSRDVDQCIQRMDLTLLEGLLIKFRSLYSIRYGSYLAILEVIVRVLQQLKNSDGHNVDLNSLLGLIDQFQRLEIPCKKIDSIVRYIRMKQYYKCILTLIDRKGSVQKVIDLFHNIDQRSDMEIESSVDSSVDIAQIKIQILDYYHRLDAITREIRWFTETALWYCDLVSIMNSSIKRPPLAAVFSAGGSSFQAAEGGDSPMRSKRSGLFISQTFLPTEPVQQQQQIDEENGLWRQIIQQAKRLEEKIETYRHVTYATLYTNDLYNIQYFILFLQYQINQAYRLALDLKEKQDDLDLPPSSQYDPVQVTHQTNIQSNITNYMEKKRLQEIDTKNPHGITALRKLGYTDNDLAQCCHQQQISLKTYHAFDFPVKLLRRYGVTLKQLVEVGYTCKQLFSGGFPLDKLKQIGFTPQEMFTAGITVQQLKLAYFTDIDILSAGYDIITLKEAGYDVNMLIQSNLLTGKLTLGQLLSLGFSVKDLRLNGYHIHEFYHAGYVDIYSLIQSGFNELEIKSVGYHPQDILVSGHYSFHDLVKLFQFTDDELINLGYILQVELDILFELFSGTDGQNWFIRTGWEQLFHTRHTALPQLSTFHGIKVEIDVNHGISRVTEIHLSNNGLLGPLPSRLASGLKNLKRLYFSMNDLTGWLPSSLTNSYHLEVVDVRDNPQLNISTDLVRSLGKKLMYLSEAEEQEQQMQQQQSHSPNIRGTQQQRGVMDDIEYTALMAIFQHTNGSKWKNSSNWGSDQPLANWFGVTTNKAGRVTRIELPSNKLHGVLPNVFEYLPDLQVLDLRYNTLFSTIPESICSLGNLTHLYLQSNAFSGSIPKRIGKLSHLVVLDMRSNELTGAIPDSITQLKCLNILAASSNLFSLQYQSQDIKKLMPWCRSVSV